MIYQKLYYKASRRKIFASPPIHVSCQRMCVQEGVSDILATPVKGWKIENTFLHIEFSTSILTCTGKDSC